ncbi:19869_t:CDS:1, partial [Gigaspora rosea]
MSSSNNFIYFTSTHEINTSKKNGTTNIFNFRNSENVKIIIR